MCLQRVIIMPLVKTLTVTVQVFNYLKDYNFSGTSVFTLLNINLLNLNEIHLGKNCPFLCGVRL
jgi:hypothetical protein